MSIYITGGAMFALSDENDCYGNSGGVYKVGNLGMFGLPYNPDDNDDYMYRMPKPRNTSSHDKKSSD